MYVYQTWLKCSPLFGMCTSELSECFDSKQNCSTMFCTAIRFEMRHCLWLCFTPGNEGVKILFICTIKLVRGVHTRDYCPVIMVLRMECQKAYLTVKALINFCFIVVFFLLGDFPPSSEFYLSTFRNTLSIPSSWIVLLLLLSFLSEVMVI
jgi:hypothetical protein